MKILLIGLLSFFFVFSRAQQKVISLYQGAAPGSETWTWNEKESKGIVYDVSHPTLTVFLPDSAVSTGTAVVIFPGGAFQILSIEDEGFEVAHWLNKEGITAFVLKYRLAHSLTDNPVKELFAKQPNSQKFNEDIKPMVAMDLADGQAALTYVRKHAIEFHVTTTRIGILGFSAGGTVAAGLAYLDTAEDKPDFVGTIYPYVGSFPKTSVPEFAPPLFILVAADDPFGFDPSCIQLYKDWRISKHIAELHVYSKGGHGFGMKKQGLPIDNWIERFHDWLKQQGF